MYSCYSFWILCLILVNSIQLKKYLLSSEQVQNCVVRSIWAQTINYNALGAIELYMIPVLHSIPIHHRGTNHLSM